MKHETAAEFTKKLWAMYGELNQLVWLLKNNCAEEEYQRYKLEIARLMGNMVLEIFEPIFAEHPDLVPPELKRELEKGDDKPADSGPP